MITKVPDLDLKLPALDFDLSDPTKAQQATNMASLAAGLVPGGPIVQNAGMFAAGVLGDSFEGAISWKLLKERYGDLLLQEMGETPPADRKAMLARLDQIGDDRLRALVETNPNLEGLLSELKMVDEMVGDSPTKHAINLGGGLLGAGAGAKFGMIGMMAGGVAGSLGAGALADNFREKKIVTSTARMYEQLIPLMQQPVDGGGGVDPGMAYAMLAARSHNPDFIKRVEEELKTLGNDNNITLESALQAHLQMRSEGKGDQSALSRLAASDFDNVDFASSCQCSTDHYDLTKSIPTQLAERINHGAVDPRVLVLGDLPSLQIQRPPPLVSQDVQFAQHNAHQGHGLPRSLGKPDGSLAI